MTLRERVKTIAALPSAKDHIYRCTGVYTARTHSPRGLHVILVYTRVFLRRNYIRVYLHMKRPLCTNRLWWHFLFFFYSFLFSSNTFVLLLFLYIIVVVTAAAAAAATYICITRLLTCIIFSYFFFYYYLQENDRTDATWPSADELSYSCPICSNISETTTPKWREPKTGHSTAPSAAKVLPPSPVCAPTRLR